MTVPDSVGRIDWANERRRISDLVPAGYNPRKLDDKQAADLDTSLSRFSLADPIVINADGKIIGGHQRVKIMQKRGVDFVDVRVPSRKLTDAEEKELNLRLNKNLGQWDFSLLPAFGEEMLADVVSDDMPAEELSTTLLNSFMLAKKFCSDDCSVFVCAPQGGSLGMMMMMMMKDAGLEVRHVLNWVKNCPTFSLGRLDYEYQHEPILFTWIKTHKRKRDGQFHTSVWEVNKPMSSKLHPTMKPVELPENAILNHTDAGDVCFEPFSGSGTMIIACERRSRKCRAVEISPGYVAVAIQRWVDATGGVPERL